MKVKTISNNRNNIKQDSIKCKTKIYLASFFLNLSLIVFVILIKNIIPPEIPLFYGLPEGEKQLASWWLLTTPAITATAFTMTNFIICNKIKDPLIKQLSTYIVIPINFFSVVAIVKIINLVGSM